MKKAFQHIASVSMAILVLFSTLSFTVDKHFCGSILVDKAVFSEAKTCGMEMPSEAKDSCCSNEKIAVEGQDELKQNFESLDFEKQLFLTGFVYSYIYVFAEPTAEFIPFSAYSPPKLVADIQLRDQVFLI